MHTCPNRKAFQQGLAGGTSTGPDVWSPRAHLESNLASICTNSTANLPIQCNPMSNVWGVRPHSTKFVWGQVGSMSFYQLSWASYFMLIFVCVLWIRKTPLIARSTPIWTCSLKLHVLSLVQTTVGFGNPCGTGEVAWSVLSTNLIDNRFCSWTTP